jgi:hypothetical protein
MLYNYKKNIINAIEVLDTNPNHYEESVIFMGGRAIYVSFNITVT